MIFCRHTGACIIALIALIANVAFVPPCEARAQGGILPGAIVGGAAELPPGVRRVGNIEIANVDFENQTLFSVTGPVIRDPQNPGNVTSVALRAAQIEGNLQQVLSVDPDRSVSLFGAYDTYYDPLTFRVLVTKVDDLPVLVAGDREHPSDLTLLTVTARDARFNMMDAPELAQLWQRQLQSALVQALNNRQPQLVRRHLVLVPRLIGAFLLLSIALWYVWRRLRARRAALNERNRIVNSVISWITASCFIAGWLGGLVWIP